MPTIVNGKVYVGTTNSVGIFGFVRQSTPLLADGPYVMTNASSQLVLDDPASSQASGVAMYQWPANGGLNQKWFFSFNGNGYYSIQNVSSKLFLTDPGSTSSYWGFAGAEHSAEHGCATVVAYVNQQRPGH